MIMESPSPSDVRAARLAEGLTLAAASALIHSRWRSWQNWEAGTRRMHPAMWELFLIKTHRLKQ